MTAMHMPCYAVAKTPSCIWKFAILLRNHTMKTAKQLLKVSAVVASLAVSGMASASLTTFQTFTGNYGVSSDGWGGTSQSGTISASVPAGATVVAAYLYSAMYSSPTAMADVKFGDTTINNWDQEYVNPIPPSLPNYFRTGRKDVTALVKPTIDGGPGGVYDFSLQESDSRTDGEALIVVYEMAGLELSTVAILDGGAALDGDTTQVNFSDPVDTTDPAFFAEMRLGISFSCCNQKSNVDVNGQLLTNNAGNWDDGEVQDNGSLITMGGYDDDLLNPNDYGEDDERYNLVPFINDGDSNITVDTDNPSNDDNIFVALFHVKGEATFTQDVPAPAPLALLGLSLCGLFARSRRK
ncbi:PEP-CTERM sorting domain-containing protein [Corallincola spongiicola]|uniref:PEP-CTERM sorting domain-containing protein n=2 Tax=Corallincola spongiicola TaxID=2520508 RepID=A0ABY1WNW4_9GAMM|nr:PEP-CTERM sorting domain-containing protein [Corallincola spongiicola]